MGIDQLSDNEFVDEIFPTPYFASTPNSYLKPYIWKYLDDIGKSWKQWELKTEISGFLLSELWDRVTRVYSLARDISKNSIVFFLNNPEERLKIDIWFILQERAIEELTQEREVTNSISRFWQTLLALDLLFEKNSREWFSFIDEDDKLEDDYLDESLRWKDIIEIWEIARGQLLYCWKVLSKYKQLWAYVDKDFVKEMEKKLADYEEVFLSMTMWIWKEYEWGATFFRRSKEEFIAMLENIVRHKNTKEMFAYMIRVYKKMSSYSSRTRIVDNYSYPSFVEYLNKAVLKKLESPQNNTTDKEFLYFAQIVSWRDVEMYWQDWSTEIVNVRLDEDFRDPDIASEALIHILTREWWDMEQVTEWFEDKELWTLSPIQVVDEFKEVFSSRITSETWENVSSEKFLWFLWLDISWNENKQNKYSKLSLNEKILISMLKRYTDKLRNYEIPIVWINTWIENKNKRFSYSQLTSFFWEIQKEVFNDLLWDWNENLLEMVPETWISKDAIDLYKVINWIWWGLSDKTNKNIKWLWQIASVFVLAVVLTMATAWTSSILWWALATSRFARIWLALQSLWTAINTNAYWQWAIWSAYSSIASWIVFPQRYVSMEHMTKDMWTDLETWTVTWIIWWWMVVKWWENGAKLISLSSWNIKNISIFAWDFIGLWLFVESFRNSAIEWDFIMWNWYFFEWPYAENFSDIWKYVSDENEEEIIENWEIKIRKKKIIQYKEWIVDYLDWTKVVETNYWYEVIKNWVNVRIEIWEDWSLVRIIMWKKEFIIYNHIEVNTFVYFSRKPPLSISFRWQKMSKWDSGKNLIISIDELLSLLSDDNYKSKALDNEYVIYNRTYWIKSS